MDTNWFHVFDATNSLWLQDDERSWIKRKGPDYDGVVTVLADCGTVELS